MGYSINFTRCLTSVVLSLGLLLWLLSENIEGSICEESLPTLHEVDKCPITAVNWDLAAQKKRCDAIASTQKCVSNSKRFVYHCLMNEKKNGFVEVCAPIWILTGYCGFYDTRNGRIYNDVSKDCTQFDESPCPKRFNSSDIYQYVRCYDIIKENERDPSLASTEQYLPWLTTIVMISIISLISIIILFLAIAFYYWQWKSRNRNVQTDIDRGNDCKTYNPEDQPRESDHFLNNEEKDEINTDAVRPKATTGSLGALKDISQEDAASLKDTTRSLVALKDICQEDAARPKGTTRSLGALKENIPTASQSVFRRSISDDQGIRPPITPRKTITRQKNELN